MANKYQNWIKTFESIVWKILSYTELRCGWKWNPIQIFLFAKVEDAAFKWQAPKTKKCGKRAATFRNKVSGSVRIVWDGIVIVHACHKDEHYYIGEETLRTLIETKGTIYGTKSAWSTSSIHLYLSQTGSGIYQKEQEKETRSGHPHKIIYIKHHIWSCCLMTKPNIFIYRFSLVVLG